MADWKRLSDGTWGVQSRTGRTGEAVTVTRADGSTSSVTLGTLVTRTRWGSVFAVAGRTSPARPRTAPVRRRRARRDPGGNTGGGRQSCARHPGGAASEESS